MTPTELQSFACRPVRPRFVREGRDERRARPPAREPAGERFLGETVLRDLPGIGAEAPAALRILARYMAVRALATAGGRASTEGRRAAFTYLAALEGAEEARALRRAIISASGSRARYAALMKAAREAARWEHWHGAHVLRRLAWTEALSAGQRRAAGRAARTLVGTALKLERAGEARLWRRMWRGLSGDGAA